MEHRLNLLNILVFLLLQFLTCRVPQCMRENNQMQKANGGALALSPKRLRTLQNKLYVYAVQTNSVTAIVFVMAMGSTYP